MATQTTVGRRRRLEPDRRRMLGNDVGGRTASELSTTYQAPVEGE